mgnify:CR=1 FL=1
MPFEKACFSLVLQCLVIPVNRRIGLKKSASSHLFEKGHVGGDRIAYPWIFQIGDAVFRAGLAHDLAERRIVDMRYFGEQMVFYLKIQSAHQPIDKAVTGSEVAGRLQLVNGPFIF